MGIILLVLILAVVLAGVGFAVHLLWLIAAIVLVFWLVGWAIARGESAGSRRRWYGRW
ncbi:MAG: hydrophobic protein [Acidimicrobiales bacterium]